MRRLSFVGKHVAPILAGTKTYTTRLELSETKRGSASAPTHKPGSTVKIWTGPRMAPKTFGYAQIVGLVVRAQMKSRYPPEILAGEGYPDDTPWDFCQRVMRLSGHKSPAQHTSAYEYGSFTDERGRTRWVILYRFEFTEVP